MLFSLETNDTRLISSKVHFLSREGSFPLLASVEIYPPVGILISSLL